MTLRSSHLTVRQAGLDGSTARHWGQVDGHLEVVTHQWRYAHVQLELDATDAWVEMTGGITGTTAVDYAINAAEGNNPATTTPGSIVGAGVDVGGIDYPEGFALQPVRTGYPTWIYHVTRTDGTVRYVIDVPNDHDGSCALGAFDGEEFDSSFCTGCAAEAEAVTNTEFLLEVAKGNVSGHALVQKFGRNADVDSAAAEDVWSAGGVWAPPTVARVHQVTSSDANDTSAGTGAQTVTLYGLDSSGELAEEVITMNGVSDVATIRAYMMVHRLVVTTSGSGDTNAGTITATADTDATVTAQIEIGDGQTLMAIYQVPTGKTGYLLAWYADLNKSTGGSDTAAVRLLADAGGGWATKSHRGLIKDGTSGFRHAFDAVSAYAAGTLIKVHVHETSANNNDISAGFDLMLVDD